MAQELRIVGIRGATTVDRDDAKLIRSATKELLAAVVERNGISPTDIVSVIFTATPDLTSEFPAHGARELGWNDVPLLCATEINVQGALGRCIRVLLHVTTDRPREQIQHVYLHSAVTLRPDLASS